MSRSLLSLCALLVACLPIGRAVAQSGEGLVEDSVQRTVEQTIDEARLRGHIRFLADDLLEGRGPGSRGDDLTQLYISTQLQSMGYQPATPGGGWYQPVPLVGVRTKAPESVTFHADEEQLQLDWYKDYIFAAGKPTPKLGFTDAELVFVGYGIEAPEYQWDDFKDVDLKGKVLVMMNNDPSDDPELFAGRRRLYYGRWDYKYESAARQGAVGAIIIHTTESAGYPYQVVQTSWTGEEFELRGTKGPRLDLAGWFTEDAARRVTKLGGFDLDDLRRQAEERTFRPVPLGVRFSLAMTAQIRNVDTRNVLGVLPGSDPKLRDQWMVYMAHHDHIGMAAQRDERGDNIYNGAVDNASGVASLLSIAAAYARLPERPKRSILIATVGAEEQGLLGSEYLAAHPPVPAGRLAAVINIDGVNIFGPTSDVNVIGLGKSSMDQLVERVANWQQRSVTPDQFPDRGYYYRSDQFSLAKVGVPGVYLHGGTDMVGKPAGWGREQKDKWTESRYHQPSDEYSPDWDLRGAVQDSRLLFYTGYLAAQDGAFPSWTPGDEFEAARKAALEAD